MAALPAKKVAPGAPASGRRVAPPGGGGGAGSPRPAPAKARAKAAAAQEPEPYLEEAETLSWQFVEAAPVKLDESVEELDYTVDSIRVLDRACRFKREAFDDALILGAGFYFGEMLRRAYKGRYRWDERQNALALEVEGLTIFPIEKVRGVVQNREKTNLQEFLLVLAKKIADQRGYGKQKPAPPPPAKG